MFLLILESIGTSELILIGVIALIFLGPRKLPQIAKTIGKTLAEFRSTTNEFKATWEREVNFEEEQKALKSTFDEKPVARDAPAAGTIAPEIKPADPEKFRDAAAAAAAGDAEAEPPADTKDDLSDKQNWL